MKRARYPTCSIEYAGELYTVHLRVIPGHKAPHVGADSPHHMDPGASPRASVIRILNRAGIVVADQVTHELSHWARREIETAALKLVAKGGVCFAVVESKAVPSFEDAEALR